MAHIERRRNLWYAILTVPADVRSPAFAGGRMRFVQSLGTSDKRIAQSLAAPVVAKWSAMIRMERGEGDAVTREALRWRDVLVGETNEETREALEHQATERAEEIAGPDERNLSAGQRFASIALGTATPSGTHYDAWKAQLELSPKTVDQMQKDVSLLIKRFPTLQAVTHQAVKGWLDEMTAKQVSRSSRARIISFCRNYWGYLKHVNAIPSSSQPFTDLGALKKNGNKKSNGKLEAGGSWEPFTPKDVVALWKKANANEDAQLADLIMLGAYSGARIEELCSLKVTEVATSAFKIKDAKTAAGIREVPIHSNARELVRRLKRDSKDGYLLSGLTVNKYSGRSNAVGKRFGRLKVALGHGPLYVFHSIRKTFVTQLENGGVAEGVAADIVGHEKPNITYGVYSGGASLSKKAQAVELVKYPSGMR